MLYKFKSAAAGDLIMLEPNGRRVLDVMGKEPGPQGIVLPEQMDAAIAALEQAIAQEEAQHQAGQAENPEAAALSDAVPLRQRALPFIEMLKRCKAADKNIVWGV
jgi:hypothetical protein